MRRWLRSVRPPPVEQALALVVDAAVPLLDQTPPPAVDPTPASPVEPAPGPVVDPTPAPVVEPASAPVIDETPAPVAPAPGPVVDPTPAPVESAPAPVLDPAPAPPVVQAPAPVVGASPRPRRRWAIRRVLLWPGSTPDPRAWMRQVRRRLLRRLRPCPRRRRRRRSRRPRFRARRLLAAGPRRPSVGIDTSDTTRAKGPVARSGSLIAAILASGAPAALMAVTSLSGPVAPSLVLSAATRRALARNARSAADADARKPPPTGHGGGGGKGPAPSGPPGSAAAGAGGAAPGGFSSAPLSDVILVLLALVAGELRRLRLRPSLSAPSRFHTPSAAAWLSARSGCPQSASARAERVDAPQSRFRRESS